MHSSNAWGFSRLRTGRYSAGPGFTVGQYLETFEPFLLSFSCDQEAYTTDAARRAGELADQYGVAGNHKARIYPQIIWALVFSPPLS